MSGLNVRLIDVVVVDDDADTREMLRIILREHRCAVRTASSADEALRLIRDSIPDVLVTDNDLGGGATGWALATALRDDPRTKHVGRILVSGSDLSPLDVTRVFDAHARKPVELDRLIDLFYEVTEITRAGRRRAG